MQKQVGCKDLFSISIIIKKDPIQDFNTPAVNCVRADEIILIAGGGGGGSTHDNNNHGGNGGAGGSGYCQITYSVAECVPF